MTSGTSSPTPTDSPSLSQRPLLRGTQHMRKTVEFEVMPARKSEDGLDPESLTLRHKDGRLTQPRMSLHGKPLNLPPSRRDARYRRIQNNIYNFLERPRGVAILYHITVFFLVFTCLALSVFSTIDEYEDTAGDALFYMESLLVVWFGIELGLRLWSSGCRSRYQKCSGRFRFFVHPFCLIDIVTIVASIIMLAMRSGGQLVAASALRGLRFFQILRMLRVDRRAGTWKLLGSVVYAHRQELITTLYLGFLGLISASFLVFLAEKDVNKKFSNFAQALWWGVITLCTVGYGDMVPETWQGKMIASFCALLGISFFALPAGILGSGFALKVQQQQRQKHIIRRRQPAATLIQCLWRCYASDEQSHSLAAWKIPVQTRTTFKHNASFVRIPTLRRNKSTSLHSPSINKGPTRSGRTDVDMNASAENLGGVSNNGTRNLNASYSEDSVAETMFSKDDEGEEELLQLTSLDKTALRAIRKIKYFAARRKFREALKPYDVKDVIEQYSTGHADLLTRVKNLQFRLDQILGKQGSNAKDVYASKQSLAFRVVEIERRAYDIESKMNQFFDLYREDRKRFLALPYTQQSPIINPSTSVLKPKPILVDKQLSEPSSPITKSFKETSPSPPSVTRRPMHRGYSDLGNRIKKRVTLSTPYDNDEVVIVAPPPPPALPTYSAYSSSTSTSTMVVLSEVPTQERDLGSPRTMTESSILTEECDCSEGEAEGEEYKEENEDEDIEDMEDINETTLLCPPKPTEIIITPMTLDSSTRDNYYESINMGHLRPYQKNANEDV